MLTFTFTEYNTEQYKTNIVSGLARTISCTKFTKLFEISIYILGKIVSIPATFISVHFIKALVLYNVRKKENLRTTKLRK